MMLRSALPSMKSAYLQEMWLKKKKEKKRSVDEKKREHRPVRVGLIKMSVCVRHM